jgi:hypothetical protein
MLNRPIRRSTYCLETWAAVVKASAMKEFLEEEEEDDDDRLLADGEHLITAMDVPMTST